ncbi:MAG: hypothetical protein RL624_1133 [Bacteroidota bacterium]|jgi:hypothetical protein
MKKHILSFLIFLFPFYSSASNLVFNQVLTYAGEVNNTSTPVTLTVPTGKVWKIEYLKNPSTFNTVKAVKLVTPGTSNGNIPIDVEGLSQSLITQNFWLKSGDQLYISGSTNSTSQASYFISIIEYNVVP